MNHSPGRVGSGVPGLLEWRVPFALLAAALVAYYGPALYAPFQNDDYVFLDRTRTASFCALWGRDALVFGWWRPISRELSYWSVQRMFGANELAFHVTGFAVAIAVLVTFFLLVRRLAGTRIAAIAAAGIASLAAWAVPLVWIAGMQETWMLLFALLAIHAFVAGSTALATLAFAAALLSKETAVVVPAIAVAGAVLAAGTPWRTVALRAAPLVATALAWAALHPAMRRGAAASVADAAPWTERVVRTLLVPVNLDVVPVPASWPAALPRALAAAAILALLAAWGASAARTRHRREAPPITTAPSRLVAFGAAWAIAGWAPALLPSIGWHAYYTLLGAFGAWLAIAVVLAKRPVVAGAMIAALCVVRALAAATPSLDWGTESYQQRAARFLAFMRSDLRRVAPAAPAHTRFFFSHVPSNVGFLTEGGPALRVWYGDPTLTGAFLSAYGSRAAGAPQGPDRFFRYDSTSGWIEIRAGAEEIDAARRASPHWAEDHRDLAAAFARASEWRSAAIELEKLALAQPGALDPAADAAVSFAMAGDSSSAAHWFEVAARHPAADDTLIGWARAFARHRKAVR